MKRTLRKLWFLVLGALFLGLTGSVTQSEARVTVNIGVKLPSFRFPAPPDVVVIPGTYVYMVPDVDVDILFFQGFWWRPYEGRWYRSRDYQGSWTVVAPGRIPPGLKKLPPNYRQGLSPGHQRIKHQEVKKNWKTWEKEKYWDKQGRGGPGENDRPGPNEDKGRR